jgi:hypothetical protein
MSTKQFGLGAVLTVTTGRFLVKDIDKLYGILNHMTGDNLFTHQLPRAADACAGPLLAQFPQLAGVVVPQLDGRAEYEVWLASRARVLGSVFDVEPLESWQHRDALAELAEMTDKPIIPIIVE